MNRKILYCKNEIKKKKAQITIPRQLRKTFIEIFLSL